MASYVATAFVTIKPDLSKFSEELRTGLKTKIDGIGVAHRTVQVKVAIDKTSIDKMKTDIRAIKGLKVDVMPVLAGGTRAALVEELAKIKGLTVEVMPVLAGGTRAALVEEAAKIGAVPVDAIVTNIKVDPVAAKKASEAVAAEAAAGVGVAGATAAGVGVAGVKAAGAGTVRDTGAGNVPRFIAGTESAVAAEEALAGAMGDVTAKSAAELLAVEQLELAIGRLTAANIALSTAQKEGASTDRIKQLQSNVSGRESGVNARRIQLQEIQNAEPKGPSARATSAADKYALAQASVAEATRLANIEELTQLNTTDAVTASKEASAAISKAKIAAEAEENATLLENISLLEIDQKQTNLLAKAKLSHVEAESALLKTRSAGLGFAKEITVLQKEEAAASAAVSASSEALTLAIASNNNVLITSTKELHKHALALHQDRIAALEAAQAHQLTVPASRSIGRITELAAVASTVPKGAEIALIRDAAAKAARAHTLATLAVNEFSKAESGATEKQILRLQSLERETLTLQTRTAAELKSAEATAKSAALAEKSAARAATASRQARQGAIATGAGFLGLRGAVLAASLPFLAATIGITAFAKIVGTAGTLEQSLNVFQSVTAATSEQMTVASDVATQLGADLTLPATSANDAAAAMTELARAGLTVNDSLSATRGVLELAAAASISVGDASTIVATELNAFGLAGTEATMVADVLAGSSIAAQGEITDFGLAFQQVAAVAHQVQLPFQTTAAILTQFAQAGLKGSDAGTSLRTMLLRLVPTSKAAQDAVDGLGIKIDRNIPIGEQFTSLIDQYTVALAKLGPVAQQETLTKIFGQDAIRGASISLTKGSAELTSIQGTISEVGLAAQLSSARMKGFSGSVEGLSSSVTTLAGALGKSMLPLLTSIVHELSSVTQTATTATGALQSLGNISIKPAINLVGGSDIAAQVGLAIGAGAGIRALANRRSRGAEAKDALNVEKKQILEEEQLIRTAQLKALGIETNTFKNRAQLRRDLALEEAKLAESTSASNRIIAQSSLQSSLVQNKGANVDLLRASQAKAATAAIAAEEGLISSVRVVGATYKSSSAAAIEAGRIEAEAALSATKAHQVNIASIRSVAASYKLVGSAALVASETEILASRRSAQAILAGTRTRASGILSTNKALGAGLAATLAGGILGGDKGGLLSSLGTGLTIASFIPGAGIAASVARAGLAAGIPTLKLLSDAKKRAEEEKKKILSEWQKMTFEEQQAFLRANFPAHAVPPGRDTTPLQDILSGIKEPPLVAAQNRLGSIFTQAPSALPAGANQGQIDAFNKQKALSDRFTSQLKKNIGSANLFIPTAADYVNAMGGFNMSAADIAAVNLATAKAVQGFNTEILNTNLLEAIKAGSAIPAGLSASIDRESGGGVAGPLDLVLKFFGKIPPASVKLKTVMDEVTQGTLELAIASARMTGSTENLDLALQDQIDADKKAAKKIEDEINAPLIPGDLSPLTLRLLRGEELVAKQKELQALYDRITSNEKNLSKATFSFSSSFIIKEIKAGATPTQKDDLKLAQDAVEKIKKRIASKQDNGADLDALKQQQATAEAKVSTLNQAIATADKAASDSLLSQTEANIRTAAQVAGSIGPKQDALIAFDIKFLNMQKAGSQARIAAQLKLNEDQRQGADALSSLQVASLAALAEAHDNRGAYEDNLIKALDHRLATARENLAKGLVSQAAVDAAEQALDAELAKKKSAAFSARETFLKFAQQGLAFQASFLNATKQFALGGKNLGLIAKGNIDLLSRPEVTNPAGGTSTVFSTSFGTDKGIVLLSRVFDGKVQTAKAAWQHYLKTGENLGTFISQKSADSYAKRLHMQQQTLGRARRSNDLLRALYTEELNNKTSTTDQKIHAIEGLATLDQADAAATASAVSVTENALRAAAEATDHRGRAEERLLENLKKQKDKMQTLYQQGKVTREELDSVTKKYHDEVIAGEKAKETAVTSAFDLRSSRLDTAAARAAITATISDDKKVLNARISLEKDRIRYERAAQKGLATTSDLYRDHASKIETAKQALIGYQQQLKGLSGGALAKDIFKEAVNQFLTYGSNIAGRNGVLSPQDARASFGLMIINRSNAQLTEAQKHTTILEGIYKNTLMPVPQVQKGTDLDFHGLQKPASYLSMWGARSLGEAVQASAYGYQRIGP